MVLGARIQRLLLPQPSVPMVSPRQALWGVLGQGTHLVRLANPQQMEVVPGTQLPLLTGQGQDCFKGVAGVAE